MARALTLGNGSLLVTLDEFGFVRDFYYPYVGLENHVAGQKHRIGVRIGDKFSWIDDGSWQITIGYKPETMVGYLVCKNDALQITVVMEDIAYNEAPVFLRQVDIYNHAADTRDCQVFFHQVFHIGESRKRNTAFYDPTHNAVVHYKGQRVFIINGRNLTGEALDQYTVGAYQYEDKEGSFRDAEDGQLSSNAVEHGSVDSVIRLCVKVEPKEKGRIYYWICAGKSLEGAYELNEMVLHKTPAAMVHSTEAFWHSWLNTHSVETQKLAADQKKLFDTSLFILRSHIDNGGAIIASADSAMIEYGKDDYAYMWPRDAAFIVSILAKAGYTEATRPFFEFCREVLHPDGYLHHRFRPDKSLGSTWHSTTSQSAWLTDKILQLPIQEDESASVLVALWDYYHASKDLEFVELVFKPLVEKIAEFLVSFRDKQTGLPLPSYDLWEEHSGVSTYTCAAVYGGLHAAAQFCELLEKRDRMRRYKDAAKELKQAIVTHLFDKQMQTFVRGADIENGQVKPLKQVDSSALFGLWHYGVFEVEDPLMMKTHQAVEERLRNPGPVGGYLRYEGDAYFRAKDLSNPWFITTLWQALRLLSKKEVVANDLQAVETTLAWVAKHVYQSGILAEQLDPYTGESQSATPLAWSHAVYVETVMLYLQRKQELEQGSLTVGVVPREL